MNRMITHDFDFLDEVSPPSPTVTTVSKPVEPSTDFDDSIVKDYPFLVKYHTINRYYSEERRNMEALLNNLGLVTRGSNMFCPFHNDEYGGKESAKYHPDSDTVFCFSESKLYTSYHALKILYGLNMEKIFREAWLNISDITKEELLQKYSDESEVDKKEFINPVWKRLTNVLYQFSQGNVTFKQHKTAISKVITMIVDSKELESANL